MAKGFRRHQKIVIWLIVFAFFVGGVGLFSLNRAGFFNRSTSTSSGPTYAAIVNGDKISIDALNAAADQTLNRYKAYYQQMGLDIGNVLTGAGGQLFRLRIQAEALNELIRQVLYRQEARARGITVSKTDVEAEAAAQYENFLRTYNISEQQLSDYLRQAGTTLAEFKDSIRTEVETQLLTARVQTVVAGPIDPSEDDLEAYFEAHISSYDQPEKIRASHILVDDEKTAEEVLSELKDGADFAGLAKAYSKDTATKDNGGDLGWFSRGKMVREFEDAAFGLKNIGDISDIVKTSYGYHIIKLTGREPAHTPTFDEVKDQVRDDYIQEKKNEKVANWYNALYSGSDIEIELPLLRAYLYEQDDLDRGLAEFERIRDTGESADPYIPYYIGRIYEVKAAYAADELRELRAKEDPTDEEKARIAELQQEKEGYQGKALAAYLDALENVDADENFLGRVLSLNPENLAATVLLGKLKADQGDYVTAENHFAEAIKNDPTYVPAYLASGDLAVRQGNYPLAESRYEAALEQRPNDTSIMFKLVNVYIAMNELGEASELVAKIRKASPDNVKGIIAEGDLAYAQLTAAVDELNGLKGKDSPTGDEEARLSELQSTVDTLYQRAVDRYEEGLRRGGTLDLNVKLGNVHLLAGHLDEAEDQFRNVILRSPYRVEAYMGLGEVYLKRGDTEAALENFRTGFTHSVETAQREEFGERILELDPQDTDTRYRLARLYASESKWAEAIRHYEKVIEAAPSTVDAYLGIAEAYAGRGEYAAGIDYLNRGLAVATDEDAKIRLYNDIVDIAQAEAGEGNPLGTVGLDALIELARLHITKGEDQTALDELNRVKGADETYRADEVASLVAEAGGAVQTESAEVTPTPAPSDAP